MDRRPFDSSNENSILRHRWRIKSLPDERPEEKAGEGTKAGARAAGGEAAQDRCGPVCGVADSVWNRMGPRGSGGMPAITRKGPQNPAQSRRGAGAFGRHLLQAKPFRGRIGLL